MTALLGPAVRPGPAPRRHRLDDLHMLLAGLVLILLWDLSALDLSVMRAFGSADGFAWRDHALTRGLLHEGGRWLGWLVMLALVVNVFAPLIAGPTRGERLRWLGATALCMLLVPALKQLSQTSCPWDLAEFGGVARYLPHWLSGSDGGPGGCFPSGHATAAFGFIGGWFVLRPHRPRAARAWLSAVGLAGIAFGAAQTLRGAHYPSHVLWTAWLCWALSAALLARPARPHPRD